ncbi:RING finger and SPRY domain-containing protein 1-like [Sitodiplosis mosellana]|uniref:RING finger and SPRY domain-containing protein 1-like n=1 Tax=Sitodiplosis mosellana TaxID=263140 RepID=UPI002443863B|nr:RING finger and SPRY domain-containing protein 1-like [Sitodiplosis mosellana]XP_055299380.1 RING finger and SPRY domain-containing protein 1-like [Sitodiplosis mosellana]XP_055299381.1 RING finger and SPRY domain-containing protein 1-like [Sitodiplosis mosellana]XP_055299383.1 RING finger and SPRY domain-containing protein 1-like [Sitodiplosis mosellana]
MGVCLCKSKTSDDLPDNLSQSGRHSMDYGRTYGRQTEHCNESLSETVDRLVKETLKVIGTIVDNEPEPPSSMVQLHDITDKPNGWIQLVKSLIRVVPIEHAMGPSVITLLLDDSPLPTKDSVLEVADMISYSLRRTPRRERNLCVILGCLAEKLAGPSSIAVLSESTLSYLIGNLDEGIYPEVMLFSIIALEKFAQKSENKATIKRKLAMFTENPLLRLERHANSDDHTLRQVGYCARWCLDNYFIIEGRKYSYEVVDVSNVNVMLNTRDVSEYLKISPDGLEARCDAYLFESVRCTYQVNAGCWYYEVTIITPGVMQIGWATKDSNFLSHEGYGIGDDPYSIAFDGCRRLIWHNAKSLPHDLPSWQGGSVLGCLLDLDAHEVIFSLNGVEGGVLKQVFGSAKDGFFAAASCMSFQQCRFNFGSEPFKFPPKSRAFDSFNSHAYLKDQDKIVLPRHLFLEQLRKLSVREDSCTLCFDLKGIVRLEPCTHRGFCMTCASQLQHCPLCRAEIVSIVKEESDTPTSDDFLT